MRPILAAPRRCLGAAGWLLVLLLVMLLVAAAPVLAADPTATPATGDVRSSSTAPGLVGDPLFALAGVVAIGLIAVGATLLYVRLTSRP